MYPSLQCGDRELDLSYPVVMGILNITPDSFSDGGQLYRYGRVDLDALIRRAEHMVDAGAAMLDIGGESTRPGAATVSEAEELDRVLIAVEAVASRLDVIISVDSSTPRVMTESALRGAGFLNDVRGFRRPGAMAAARDSGLPLCIMHMQGEPDSMQANPRYDDVLADIQRFFSERLAACNDCDIPADRIVIDPGFGFGKTPAQNFELLARLPELSVLGRPLLVGLSRKSMIASVLDRTPEERTPASIGLAMLAAERGARILRVHDVRETADALAMWRALPQDIRP